MSTLLLRGGLLHAARQPGQDGPPTALLVDGSTIAWMGDETVAVGLTARADRVIDLEGALVAPGFVDSHVHALPTGLSLLGESLAGLPEVAPEVRTKAYRAALGKAAELGIVALHEMSFPELDTRAGLKELVQLSLFEAFPQVVAYRGELLAAADQARALQQQMPFLAGVGGDLNIDGHVHDGTAAMRTAYQDVQNLPGTTDKDRFGELLLSARQIATHIIACAAAGIAASFRVAGDRGMDEFVAGLELSAATLGAGESGAEALRRARVRIEQALFVDTDTLAALIRFGVMPSIQPAVDVAFGGAEGPWAHKVGVPRAADMAPIADLTHAGLTVGFGSGSPMTPLGPWEAIRAAINHHDGSQRISLWDAFNAHTVGGWRLAGLTSGGAGVLEVGNVAHLAVWRAENYLTVDPNLPSWASIKELPPLPDLSTGTPVCLQTLRSGVVLHDTFL